jgi:lactoylglutathione lyase
MELGAFSISLAVADLEASRSFYGKLGFEPIGGEADEGWLILTNGAATIRLFQGMFDRNILTFNPGMRDDRTEIPSFTDVRTIQAELEAAGLELDARVADDTEGPGHLVVHDPDGNPVLIDQFR